MHDTPLPDLVLYARPGCGLCDEARDLLIALLGERARAGLPRPDLVERDIEADPALDARTSPRSRSSSSATAASSSRRAPPRSAACSTDVLDA